MFKILQGWFNRYFSDPEAITLLVILFSGFTLIITGNILVPILLSIVISYLLRWWVLFLTKRNVPYVLAYNIVYLLFIAIFAAALLLLLPLVWRQLTNLFVDLPQLVQTSKINLLQQIKQYSMPLSTAQIDSLTAGLVQNLQAWGKQILSFSLASIPGIIAWAVYLILVPLLVYFFLKDHDKIVTWFVDFLPQRKKLLKRVWQEMDQQIGNYIRGKLTEILIVGFGTYLVFYFFGLRYQLLLACLVGLSVVIPYVGAVVVTIPVVLVGYFQWGFADGLTGHFAIMFYVYLLVQFLDGNILVPLLFSEAVNLHPIAIIVAILIFGAFWGFWGIFFAIPLATLVKAVVYAWPRI